MKIKAVVLTIFLVFNLVFAVTAKIDSLSNELNAREESDKTEIYNLLAEAYWYSSPDKTIDLGKIALELADKYNDEEQKVLALINIGNGFMFTGRFKEALKDYLEPGLKLAEEIEFEKGIAGGLNSIAASYMNLGNYHTALLTFKRSLEILERNNDHEKAARIKMNIAALYSNWGNYDIALEYYFDVLEVFERKGDHEILSRVLNNVAVTYHGWGNYTKALEFYNRSLELYNEMEDELGKAIPLNNIGEIFKDRKMYATAFEYYQRSLVLVVNSENKQSIGIALQGSGEALKGLEDYDLATDYLLRALDNFKNIGFQEGIANSYHELGDIQLIQNNYGKALEYLNKSLELSIVSNIRDLMKKNYFLLSEAYKNSGDYDSSLEHFKSYSSIKDSIFSEETQNKITELDIKYNTAKLEQEIDQLKEQNKLQKINAIFLLIALLFILIILIILFIYYRVKKKTNVILKSANLKIQKQRDELEKKNLELNDLNATHNKFFSIIAHDLKNAFIAQRSGSKLLSKDIDSFDNNKIKSLATELHHSAENLFKLLQNLLDWSRIQTKRIEFNPELILLDEFIKEDLLILEHIASRKSITLNYDVEPGLTMKADRNMLNSILQNLINNGIKFSYPNSDIIIIARSFNKYVELEIVDQGVGIDEKDLNKLFRIDGNFSKTGTAKEKGSGLGLVLCKEFIELHSGTIEINSVKDKGTSIKFSIPSV
jgi:signal transduction histidine kinase